MKLKHALTFALVMAVAIALSPLAQLRAAPMFGNSQGMTSDLAQTVQMKAKKKAKKGKKAKGKKQAAAAKSCGTFKYRKGGKCVDARDKK